MTTITRRKLIPVNITDFESYPPILTRLYAGRNIQSTKSLDYSVSQLLPTNLLSGMNNATQILAKAIHQHLN